MFKIDFFELLFLAEACIPPQPIARYTFFENLSSVYYHQMTDEQRKQMFEKVVDSVNFDVKNEDCQHFYARFNPTNKKIITTKDGWTLEEHEVYYFKNKSHVSRNKWIDPNFIVDIN